MTVELLQLADEVRRLPPAELTKFYRRLSPEERVKLDDVLEESAWSRTPGTLAQKLDPLTIQTPALEIIDNELVEVRDAIAVMYERRARYRELVAAGVPQQVATEAAAEEIADRGNDRLILSMPPQEGKTERVSRRGIEWFLRQFADLRVGLVSFDGKRAGDISYQIRGDIAINDGTGGNFDMGLRLATDSRAMGSWRLAAPNIGNIRAIGIGGGLTGQPLDYLDIDDPVKDYRDADSLLKSRTSYEWWQTVGRPRLGPWAPVVIVSVRWHELDIVGRLKQKQREDEEQGLENFDRWRVVNIPAQADSPDDILDREPGEFMVSARGRTRAQWEATKAATAPRFWSAMYQGEPSPKTGDIFEEDWWDFYYQRLWTVTGAGSQAVYRIPAGLGTLWQSWDMTFADTAGSDFVCAQVWLKTKAQSFLLDQVNERMDFPTTLVEFAKLTRKWPQARGKIVEKKANGAAVISTLKGSISGIIAYDPGRDSKEARAIAMTPLVQAHDVILPAPEIALFDVAAFIQQHTDFPTGAHDDMVDADSQFHAKTFGVKPSRMSVYQQGATGARRPPASPLAAPIRALPPAMRAAVEAQLRRSPRTPE